MIVFLRSLFVNAPNAVESLATWPGERMFAYETIETFLLGYVDQEIADITTLATPVAFVNNDSIPIEEYTGYPDDNLDRIRELTEFRGFPYQQWGDSGITATPCM